MDKDTESFVRLKYEIITIDQNTWQKAKEYPIEVRVKWAWRCLDDATPNAEGNADVLNTLELAKKCAKGECDIDEVRESLRVVSPNHYPSFCVAEAASWAALTAIDEFFLAAPNAAYCSYLCSLFAKPTLSTKYDEYLIWLVEELCEWELKNKGI